MRLKELALFLLFLSFLFSLGCSKPEEREIENREIIETEAKGGNSCFSGFCWSRRRGLHAI